VVAQNIFFGLIAAVMIIAALRVVTTSNVVHAALWLVVVMSGAASLYLLLGAEFVGVTQILVYVGAVMVLLLFGTMLTRAVIGAERDIRTGTWWVGIPTALLLFGLLGFAIVDQFEDEELPTDPALVSVQQISDAIFSPYLVPFFALSFVLLAALVGAIVIARRD
jgi:NADH-quinone oxidoreductase subunit J